MPVKKAKQAKVATRKSAKVNVKVKKVSKSSRNSRSSKREPTFREKQTRVEILQHIAEQTGLSRTQVESVFDSLYLTIAGHMKKKGSGEFTIPKTGIKLRRVPKKASKARKMFSPLTNTEVIIAAKAARYAVKLSALKILKDMVEK